MDLEYWWLIVLPLFFTLGWIAARIDIKQLIAESTSLPAAYFKGLNFLITDQHDKAIEAYKKSLELSPRFTKARYNLGSIYKFQEEQDL
jgi:lipopolysaccharide biosynthesis regulator YciM